MELFAVITVDKSAPEAPSPAPHSPVPASLASHSSDWSVEARRDQRRVLLAGARVLADDPSASIQQVADEAQVARATAYRLYPATEALLTAIGREAGTEFAAALEHARAAGDGAAATLSRLIRELARIGADYPIVLKGPLPDDSGGLTARVEELIADGQAAGELRGDVATDVLRRALFGALSATLRPAGGPLSEEIDSDEIGTRIAAVFVDGMREKGAPS